MFSFESYINLPLVWGGLIATAVLLYVLLDGFDLGVGILFPFAPTDNCRNRAINSIAPFWDGNETWLVLGGGGLFAAFPLAYSIVMPAMYIPVICMLLCLIFRGVAFEFRFKANRSKKLWDMFFHFGSLGAAFMQGVILGGLVQGIEVEGRGFSGGAFDWLTAFSIVTGLGVVAGYVLLGATWLVMKTEGETQGWARRAAQYILVFVAMFMGLVSLWVPFLDTSIHLRWFDASVLPWLLPIPVLTFALFVWLFVSLRKGAEYAPFLCSIGIFALGYLGLGVSLWPWAVPFAVSLEQAAAAPESLSLMLVGAAVMLPVILCYTAYCYYIFRGKAPQDATYG
ncbi:MAG TPA: cytochrome d ubiquinol oxidase subunit II [Alphaproteobacteria bacterium]|nr:cytochrome d ubiquinol oxidase subunit II [Rhodospirillaceae bacterium]HRJ65908.1 cytochrome d ubiquinol oxidase subunit II [Alphaproteobacteria bacterium]